VYGQGESLQNFEKEVAEVLGMDAAVFMISGVMSIQTAVKIHSDDTAKCLRIGLHPTSHLALHEHRAFEHIWGMECVRIGSVQRVLTADDVRDVVGSGRPKLACIVIELPQRENGGVLPLYSDLVQIRALCKRYGVRLHLDGARLWEC